MRHVIRHLAAALIATTAVFGPTNGAMAGAPTFDFEAVWPGFVTTDPTISFPTVGQEVSPSPVTFLTQDPSPGPEPGPTPDPIGPTHTG